MSASAKTRQLFEEGYAIFERAYDDAEIARFRGEIARYHASIGAPRCYAPHPAPIAPFVQAAPTGLVVAKLVERWPELADSILKEDVVAAIRGYLGEDMLLELTAAVLADETRPFFAWHTHIGGQDDSACRASGIWPTIDRPLRVGALAYMEDLDDDNGPLLLYPRALGSPTAPPYDTEATHWDGEVVVRVPRGSVVVMDECTWHTARQKTTPGLRVIVGCNFAARQARPSPLVEPFAPRGSALFRSVIG